MPQKRVGVKLATRQDERYKMLQVVSPATSTSSADLTPSGRTNVQIRDGQFTQVPPPRLRRFLPRGLRERPRWPRRRLRHSQRAGPAVDPGLHPRRHPPLRGPAAFGSHSLPQRLLQEVAQAVPHLLQVRRFACSDGGVRPGECDATRRPSNVAAKRYIGLHDNVAPSA
ncbi:uncharacterized protein LOC134787428 [Penaeus indicus]|uniref:uncharacterized protein LOC134787428 n=1 Tax=Penaeus indicus TaxID=29960 RepID=UPI00300C7ACE